VGIDFKSSLGTGHSGDTFDYKLPVIILSLQADNSSHFHTCRQWIIGKYFFDGVIQNSLCESSAFFWQEL